MVQSLTETEEDILLYNLGKRGFTLTNFDYDTPRQMLSMNEFLIKMIRDYREPRAMEGLAIAIDRDPPDYKQLIRSALELQIQNQVGYVLEGTLYVLNKRTKGTYNGLEQAVRELAKHKRQEIAFLTTIDMLNEKEMLSRNPAPEDIRWNIRGGVTFAQLDRQYCVYNGLKY
jgi:hypothetical protein